MCADTMGALGAFIGDLVSAFKPPNVEYVHSKIYLSLRFKLCISPPEPKRQREPARVAEKRTAARNLLCQPFSIFSLEHRVLTII